MILITFLIGRRLWKIRHDLLANAIAQWKNKSTLKRMATSVQEIHMNIGAEKISDFLDEKYISHVKAGFESLKMHLHEQRIRKKAINFISRTRFGKMQYYFLKWKKTPNKSYLKENHALTKLEKVLTRVAIRNMKLGYDPLKEIWYEIAQIKRKYILKMIYLTQHKSKRMFDLWAHNAKNISHIIACRSTLDLFENLTTVLKDNIAPIVTINRSHRLMAEAIRYAFH